KDVGKGLDLLLEVKKNSQEQLASIQSLLKYSEYVTAEQPDGGKVLYKLVKDQQAPAKTPNSPNPAHKVLLDCHRKDKDVVTADPDVKDVGKGLDLLLDAKKKTQEQLAAVQGVLKEAKYLSEQQPDVVRGLQQLVKDQKGASEAPAALAAAANVLRT